MNKKQKKEPFSLKNMNGLSHDDARTCALDDMNCLNGQEEHRSSLQDMNAARSRPHRKYHLTDMNGASCRGRCPHRTGRTHRFYGNLQRIRNFPAGRCGHRPLQSF